MKTNRRIIMLFLVLIVLLLSGCFKENNNGNDVENYYNDEQKSLVNLIYGEWICETEGARIKIHEIEESDGRYYVNISSDTDIHMSGEQLYNAPIFDIKAEIPHWYSITEEEYPTDTETVIWISTRDGEFDYNIVLIVDKDGEYLKYKYIDGESKWYYFYPY